MENLRLFVSVIADRRLGRAAKNRVLFIFISMFLSFFPLLSLSHQWIFTRRLNPTRASCIFGVTRWRLRLRRQRCINKHACIFRRRFVLGFFFFRLVWCGNV